MLYNLPEFELDLAVKMKSRRRSAYSKYALDSNKFKKIINRKRLEDDVAENGFATYAWLKVDIWPKKLDCRAGKKYHP